MNECPQKFKKKSVFSFYADSYNFNLYPLIILSICIYSCLTFYFLFYLYMKILCQRAFKKPLMTGPIFHTFVRIGPTVRSSESFKSFVVSMFC